jgi:predicted AlkP superfamily phosphohydrolase/phosphomutase
MGSGRGTVIFGIDGVPFHLMRDLGRRGVMPNLQSLSGEGTFRPMRSSIPDISSVSWSSIITGTNPGEHGVFGFTHLIPGTYTLSFPNFNSLKAPPFWAREGDDRTHVIVNVPFTYPARELRGFLVSGFVALDLERAVYPTSYLDVLTEMDYRIDVDAKKAEMSKGLFVRDLFATLETRAVLMRRLWDEYDWDTFMFTVTGSDRIGHLMWDAYEDDGHPHHEDFLEFFRRVDALIGEVADRMGPDDRLLMLSDHGMELIETRVNLNTLLMDEGLLRLGDEFKRGLRNIQPGSRAFSMEPSRIHVNLDGLYPKGSVAPEDHEGVVEELARILGRLEHEGTRVVQDVHRADDIYHGPHMEQAPDLVLTPAPGFSLHSNTVPKPVFEEDRLEGKHTPEAFLYVGDPDPGLVPEDPSVEDVVTIIDRLSKR